MELNKMDILAMELCDRIESTFENKVDTISIYDVVEQPNHHMFKLNFAAYDYFWVQCNYENDYFGFSIVLNDQFAVSLTDKKYTYSEIDDWDAYLRQIKENIELRIPDKFLKAKGWL